MTLLIVVKAVIPLLKINNFGIRIYKAFVLAMGCHATHCILGGVWDG